MNMHWAIFTNIDSRKNELIEALQNGEPPLALHFLEGKKCALFSKIALEQHLNYEDRHGFTCIITKGGQTLRSMSSGEQKKALLNYVFKTQHDFIVLDAPFDNLDQLSKKELVQALTKKAVDTVFIQIIARSSELLPFIQNKAFLEGNTLLLLEDSPNFEQAPTVANFSQSIPLPLAPIEISGEILIEFKKVSVRFGEKNILDSISWTIKKGQFWQLFGSNGSGKTTLLSMLTGDNPKGYGQELYLFGQKKGSGESIWEIRKKMGYFTPSMTDKFNGYHSVEHMLISGLTDSIGLYTKPTEAQQRLAKEWLQLLGMLTLKDHQFCTLTTGQQRLLMTARAMVKHPPLLILDEPTAGLDDASASLLVKLVNKLARESEITIIFVSHRKEQGLEPQYVYELQLTDRGSIGNISSNFN